MDKKWLVKSQEQKFVKRSIAECVIILQVQHVDIGSSIDLHFPNENQSFDAFQKLREIGVRCFHAGKNAPCGASVMMYSYGNDNLQLQIK